MKKALYILLYVGFLCMIILSAHASGMKYLSPDEFDKYDKLLKEKGHPELKTIGAVYDDSFDLPRIGLKCVNKKKQFF